MANSASAPIAPNCKRDNISTHTVSEILICNREALSNQKKFCGLLLTYNFLLNVTVLGLNAGFNTRGYTFLADSQIYKQSITRKPQPF